VMEESSGQFTLLALPCLWSIIGYAEAATANLTLNSSPMVQSRFATEGAPYIRPWVQSSITSLDEGQPPSNPAFRCFLKGVGRILGINGFCGIHL
jgi:hypothetical protein